MAEQLYSILHDFDTSPENKEKALHAIGNMVRSSIFCNVFNRVGGYAFLADCLCSFLKSYLDVGNKLWIHTR